VAYVLESSLATKAPKLRKAEAEIDWALPARLIRNRIRAFKPFPGTWTICRGERLSVEWAELAAGRAGAAPGEVLSAGSDGLTVQCGEGGLVITQVKPAGRKSMAADAYLRGSPVQEGVVLG
jgi:methionyl-tRNA formyltransferase